MSAGPAFSIIIVCKNSGPPLHAALDSVWTQTISAEIIVVDGGSTDGTRAWLEARRERVATLISEPDQGVYDAMNKGIAAARGQWLLFLGSDDELASDGVLSEVRRIADTTEASVMGGEAVFRDGRVYRFHPAANPQARNFIHHQAAFYRRSLFGRYGTFDPALSIMADYDFNLRLWNNRVRFVPLPLRIAVCGVAGLSDSGRWRGYREEIRVRHRHFSPLQCALWDAGSLLRFGRKKLLRLFASSHG